MYAKSLPTLLGALSLATMMSATVAAETAHAALEKSPVLVHRFDVPAGLSWGRVSVPLIPQEWHVGDAGGPNPTQAQLRTALAALSEVEIGATVTGWVEERTSYPGGIAVRELELGRVTGERFRGVAFTADSADAPRRRLPGTDTPAFRASGLIAPVLDSPRFVSVVAPQRLLGDTSAAFGRSLQFEIRAVSNPLVPSQFDRSSGVVAMRAAPH